MNKKIVFLINSLDMGGAERVVTTILNNFVKKYECHLILIENKIFYRLDNKINILSLVENSGDHNITKFFRLPIIAKKLSKIIEEKGFDKVYSFLTRANYVNIIASFFSKHSPIISHRDMPSVQYQYGLNGKINKLLIKSLYKKADLCIANSKVMKKDLVDKFNVKNVVYIPNPVDIKLINKLSHKITDIKKNKFTFVTVGRLDKKKNHKLIIEAIRDIDAELWIVGDGELKEELLFHIKKNNLDNKVYLLGTIENPYSFLSKVDCFVFASNNEGFPNVIVEALACGLPIISTDCKSGPREQLSPKSDMNYQLTNKLEIAEYGILTPLNNVDNLKKAMLLMINNKSLRKSYIKKAKIRATHFCLNNIIDKFEKIICAE